MCLTWCISTLMLELHKEHSADKSLRVLSTNVFILLMNSSMLKSTDLLKPGAD
jgi:hypothetical protein